MALFKGIKPKLLTLEPIELLYLTFTGISLKMGPSGVRGWKSEDQNHASFPAHDCCEHTSCPTPAPHTHPSLSPPKALEGSTT